MLKRIKSLDHDNFLRHNFILFCGSMVVAFFNYIYHPILGMMMNIEDFGEVQALISLFLQFGIIAGVFRFMVINIVCNSEKDEAKESVSALYKVALYLVLLISIIIIVFSNQLQQFFRFHSAMPFVILAVILFTGIPITFGEAILQGRKQFKQVSIDQSINSVGKLIFAIIFVSVGWATSGAILGIIIAQAISILYLAGKSKEILSLDRGQIHIGKKIKNNFRFAFLVLIVSLITSFLFSIDVLVIKHYFSEEIAGLYGGISIIARIVYFVTASTVGVMLPSIKIKDKEGNNIRVLKKSLLIISLIGGFTLIFFVLFPNLVITILIGKRYLIYAGLLPILSVTLFLVSIINLLFSYMLALKDYRAATLSIAGIIIIALLSMVHHDSILSVIQNSLITSIVLIIVMACLLIKDFSHSNS